MNPHPIGTFARLEAARARWGKLAAPVVVPVPPATPALVCVRQAVPSRGTVPAPLWAPSVPAIRGPGPCRAGCAHVREEVWVALEGAYPDFPVEGPGSRETLAGFMAPFMAREGWRFCSCYLGHLPEHVFISRLVDTAAANAAAELILKAGIP